MNFSFFIALGILIPFFGTCLGAGIVFFLKKNLPASLMKLFFGFAAGVMCAASVWSLLIPAIEQTDSALPALCGFLCGMLFFIVCDVLLAHFQKHHESKKSSFSRGKILALAVTLHNIPEGMAVGVIFAGTAQADSTALVSGAMILSLGIALQNIPEGAVISMPFHALGVSRKRAFAYGAFSGIVEPIGALAALLLTQLIHAALPYILSFAAGAMIYVVVQELIPEMHGGKGEKGACLALGLGFCLMMFLDVALGG